MDWQRIIRVPEAAKRLGVSLTTVRRMCRAGKLDAFRITVAGNPAWLIDRRDLDRKRKRG